MNLFCRATVLTLAAAVALSSTAQARPVIHLTLSGVLVQKTAAGQTHTVPIQGVTLHAGDRVRMNVLARNIGTSTAIDLVPVAPVPSGTRLVPGSASPAALAQYSADRVHWTKIPTLKTQAIRWTSQRPLAKRGVTAYTYDVIVK